MGNIYVEDILKNTEAYMKLKLTSNKNISVFPSIIGYFDSEKKVWHDYSMEDALDILITDVMPETLKIYIYSINDYNKILEYLNKRNFPNIKFKATLANFSTSLEQIMEIAVSQVPIEILNVDIKSIMKIEKEHRGKLKNVMFPTSNLNSHIMPHDEFFEYIDKVANFIKENTSNDYQKVLLLGEIIRKNFKYDNRFHFYSKEYLNKVANNSHYPESLLTTGKGVCNAISTFAYAVLNHPMLNIETDDVTNLRLDGEIGHAWNEVKINGKWYTCDFTQNMGTSYYGILKVFYSIEKITKCMLDKIKSERFRKIGYLEAPNLPRNFFTRGHSLYKQSVSKEQKNVEETKIYSEISQKELYDNYVQISNIDVSLENIINSYNVDNNLSI